MMPRDLSQPVHPEMTFHLRNASQEAGGFQENSSNQGNVLSL